MYVRSQKFGYFGHWLSDVNTLEMKNFDTRLVFICKSFNYKPKISMKPQNADFWFQRAANIFVGRQSSICNRAKHTFGSLNEW